MAKNRVLPNREPPSVMSSAHPHTVTIVAEDDEDNDICPVCDGECTCSNNYQPPPPPAPPARDPSKPVLKIRLPPHIPKRKSPQSSQQPPPKRRGRPPKNPALRPDPGPSTSAFHRPKPPPASQKKSLKSSSSIKDRGVRRKAINKRKRVDSSAESSSSGLTDIDRDDDDRQSLRFPTFVSAASSNSSASSSSDSGSLSGFETDESIEAEEENFILTEERARIRREFLHGNGGEETLQKRRDNNWVIRPRQMSVDAPSDVDMDGDSDATEDANDDEDEDDEDEPDGEDTEDTGIRRIGYSGLVTAWSDDEESSFDADIFFANLSDEESASSGSSTQSDDGDDGDLSNPSQTAASLMPHLRQGVGIGIPNLAFQVTEGWDGQVVFTNGLLESSRDSLQSLLESAYLPPGPEPSPSPGPDIDVDMLSTDADGEADEEGYEQDVDQDTAEAEGEGDTTDEELVGDDNLPNERAMNLFNTPFSFNNVAFINPLSTMSPVTRSTSALRHDSFFGTEFPRPNDILARRIANDIEEEFEGEELDEEESNAAREQRERDRVARGGLPRAGFFEIPDKGPQVVIDAERKSIPTSYPRFTGRRGKGVKSMSLSFTHPGRAGGFESLLRNTLSTPLRPSSLPPPSTRRSFLSTSAVFPLSPSSEVLEDTSLAPSANITSPGSTSASQAVTQPISIELDDVLDASFLAGTESIEASNIDEPSIESSSVIMSTPDSSRQYSGGLNRWDTISIGALRKTGVLTDSAAGLGSDSGPDYAAYSSVIKSSPLSTMLWHSRNGAPKPQRSMEYVMSPELGPVKDGDRTPTNHESHKHSDDSPLFNFKSRKELRKERKLKRKSYGPINNPKQHRLHHQHHHHPNSKFRSTSSSQRTNFFSSPIPSLSI